MGKNVYSSETKLAVVKDKMSGQFTNEEIMKKYGIKNVTQRGNCWDNAVIESFHSNLKSEGFQYVKFNSMSMEKVREQVDQYMKYYNEERIQEKLGYLTPIEFGSMAA